MEYRKAKVTFHRANTQAIMTTEYIKSKILTKVETVSMCDVELNSSACSKQA
jgi:hypothetical protein